MIVNDPQIAAFVSGCGVDRLFVDLEVMGKEARQPGLDTVKSVQTIQTVAAVRKSAPDAHLLVRINPLHSGSNAEINAVLAAGADSLMLPMFHDRDTLARFFDLLNGRAAALPLFETVGALEALPSMISELPLTRLHIGLNDLHLERGDKMMFAPLAEGVLDDPSQALREAGIPFGIGGLARAGEGLVPPELILGEHARLGSSSAILSRTFHRSAPTLEALLLGMDFPAEIQKLRQIYRDHVGRGDCELQKNRILFLDRVFQAQST